MPVGKTTFVFTSFRLSWVESYYYATDASLTTIHEKALPLAALRAGFLADKCKLDSVRSSLEATNRDNFVSGGVPYIDEDLQKNFSIEGLNGFSDRPWHAYKLRLRGGQEGMYSCTRFLSGVPDALTVGDKGNNWPASYKKLADKFFKALCDGSWGFKTLDKTGVNALRPVQGAAYANDYWTLSVPNHQYAIGSEIRLSGFRTNPFGAMNGLHKVAEVPNADEFRIFYPSSNFTIEKVGKVQKRVYIIVPFSDWNILEETPKKRGGRLFLPLGRRSKRRA